MPTRKQDLLQQYEQMKLRTVAHLEAPMLTEPEAKVMLLVNEDTLEYNKAMMLDDDEELIADDPDDDFEIIDWG
jgi:hypothetical protein